MEFAEMIYHMTYEKTGNPACFAWQSSQPENKATLQLSN